MLLLIAAIVAMLAWSFQIPHSVGLVLAGIGLSLLAFVPEIALTKKLIFTALAGLCPALPENRSRW